MDSIHEYFDKTRSAVQKIYQAVDSYYLHLNSNIPDIFQQSKHNDIARQERVKLEDEFSSEIFAMATLNGCILQFAHMAIELFSTNIKPYEKYINIIPVSHKAVKFCIGRIIDDVPLGLIVYAGRNQSHHYDDKTYSKITERVFHDLANWYNPTFNKFYFNNHYDLSSPSVTNYATNILWKLSWQNYYKYEKELIDLLK